MLKVAVPKLDEGAQALEEANTKLKQAQDVAGALADSAVDPAEHISALSRWQRD